MPHDINDAARYTGYLPECVLHRLFSLTAIARNILKRRRAMHRRRNDASPFAEITIVYGGRSALHTANERPRPKLRLSYFNHLFGYADPRIDFNHRFSHLPPREIRFASRTLRRIMIRLQSHLRQRFTLWTDHALALCQLKS